MRLTVRIANALYAKRHLYAGYIPEWHEYTGEIVPNPSWVSKAFFCLSTGDKKFPYRVLEKEAILGGWR